MKNIPIVQIGVTYDYTRFSCQQMMKQREMFYYCDDLHISLRGWRLAVYRFHTSKKVNNILRLPFRKLWAKEVITRDVAKNLNADEKICFIYQGGQSYLDIEAFSYLRKRYPKSILIYKYNDLVSLNERLYPGFLERCIKIFDLVITYNCEDAEKYGLILSPPVLLDYTQITPNPNQKKSDIFYVGRAKDRLDELVRLFELCRSNGLTCDFNIIDVEPSRQLYPDEISYNKAIPYMEMLQHVRNTKCVLNVVQNGARGITLRDYESIGMGKILMTNNHYIQETDMFDPNQVIFTDGEIDFGRIRNYQDAVWKCSGLKNDIEHYLSWINELINNFSRNKFTEG
jgi:hypothetical protein